MKKVAFCAAAAAMCGSLLAVESANIVGYQTKTVTAGYTLNTPTFIDVGGTGVDLANFKLGDDAAGDGTEEIQILDGSGVYSSSWIWLNSNSGMEDGWYDYTTWEPISYTITSGEGFLLTVGADVTMTSSGQVQDGTTEVSIPTGYSIFGNATPVDVDIQSITLADSAAGDGTEEIQILDASGVYSSSWIWLNENSGMEPGWYDYTTWESISATVSAGSAFLITVGADTTATLPSAL